MEAIDEMAQKIRALLNSEQIGVIDCPNYMYPEVEKFICAASDKADVDIAYDHHQGKLYFAPLRVFRVAGGTGRTYKEHKTPHNRLKRWELK